VQARVATQEVGPARRAGAARLVPGRRVCPRKGSVYDAPEPVTRETGGPASPPLKPLPRLQKGWQDFRGSWPGDPEAALAISFSRDRQGARTYALPDGRG